MLRQAPSPRATEEKRPISRVVPEMQVAETRRRARRKSPLPLPSQMCSGKPPSDSDPAGLSRPERSQRCLQRSRDPGRRPTITVGLIRCG